MELNYLSLFSGCGGADIGFHKNGFRNIGSFDINSTALTVLKNNLDVPTFNFDLSKGEPSIKEKVDVVFSGAPCQGFSTAGNRNYLDPRNNLLVRGGEIAIELSARVFVSENVMGSLSGKLRDYWDKLNVIFSSAGYKTEFVKINCLDIGMAQMRKRVLFFAWKTTGQDKIIWPEKVPGKNLGDILINANDAPNNVGYELDTHDDKLIIAKKIRPSQKLSNVRGGDRAVATWDIPEVFGKVNPEEKSILVSLRNLRRRNRRRVRGDADPVELKRMIEVHGKSVTNGLASLEEKGYVRKRKRAYMT